MARCTTVAVNEPSSNGLTPQGLRPGIGSGHARTSRGVTNERRTRCPGTVVR